jgi:phosphoheptose isomerase (EC 5.3.1.-)
MDLISRISQHFADSAQTKLDAMELLAAPLAGAAEMMVGAWSITARFSPAATADQRPTRNISLPNWSAGSRWSAKVWPPSH